MLKKLNRILTISAMCMAAGMVAIPSGDAHAGVKVKTKKTFYDVRGKDGKTLNKNMLEEGRKVITLSHAIAATRYNFDTSKPEFAVEGNKCRVKSIDVTVNLEYVYPRWLDRRRSSREMQKNWAVFWKELQRHEQQHGKIAIDAAKALEKEILKTTGHTLIACRDMGAFTGFRLANVLRRTKSLQRNFDRLEYARNSRISKLQRALYHSE